MGIIIYSDVPNVFQQLSLTTDLIVLKLTLHMWFVLLPNFLL